MKDHREIEKEVDIFKVPFMASSKEDAQSIDSIGNSAQNSMILTLVIPFVFMCFMSMSMKRVWLLYNMLQILGNTVNI